MFNVDSRLQTIGLAPALDGVPEINETFVLEIFSAARKDILGTPTNVSITILANDDWNGVFNFTMDSLNQYIGKTLIYMYMYMYILKGFDFNIFLSSII